MRMKSKAAESNLRFYAVRLADIHELRIACPEHLKPYINSIDKAVRGMARPFAFGARGAWLFQEQVDALRMFYLVYTEAEAPLVREAVEVYLKAQLKRFYAPPVRLAVEHED